MHELDILLFGIGVTALGALLLGAVVAELSRKAGLAKPLLAVGLGLGVIAFGAKLLLIASFDAFGRAYLLRFLPPRAEVELRDDPLVATGRRPMMEHLYVWEALPARAPEPPGNPSTPLKVALGKRLFHDPRLSADGTVACASCHDVAGAGGGDGQPVSTGIGGQRGGRNAPTVLNAAFQAVLFWDGRAASLEEQALGPLTNPLEMGMPSPGAVAERVAGVPEYRAAFAAAFGEGEREGSTVSADNIARAIAAYERTLITPDSPYDRFVRGDGEALTVQQRRGMALFARFGCVMCHSGPNFSGASRFPGNSPYRAFPSVRGTEYEERYHLSDDRGLSREVGAGVWRIPSLRNVTRTGPYFHNGSVRELREAVRIMARVQLDKPFSNRPEADWRVVWSPRARTTEAQPDAVLSDAEVEDIVAFLHALEGEVHPPAEG